MQAVLALLQWLVGLIFSAGVAAGRSAQQAQQRVEVEAVRETVAADTRRTEERVHAEVASYRRDGGARKRLRDGTF
jgi:hypothetical protein